MHVEKTTLREKMAAVWQALPGLLRVRRDKSPIDSVAALETFVATRSAYVAQKTLYGYVKTRMGVRYPAMFEDKNIIASLNIAKLHVVAACLSDLTIFAVANALQTGDRAALARQCFADGLRENTAGASEPFPAQDCIDEFDRRLVDTLWDRGARQPDNFTRSPQALFRWAPIADALKNFDREIVENSVIYAWRDIREQYRKRIDADAVSADWTRLSGG